MKQILTFITILSTGMVYAQVGIQTEKPTETLHVEGTLRVKELPTENEKIYTMPDGTASETKDQTFSPTKMLVVDANGVLGKADIPTGGTANGSGSANNATGGETYSGSTSIKLNGDSFERAALTGDVTADQNSNTTTIVAIQGKAISNTAPTDKQILQWNEKEQKWMPFIRPHLVAIKPDSNEMTGSTEIISDESALNIPLKGYIQDRITLNEEDNTFQVEEDGYYEVKINLSLKNILKGRVNIPQLYVILGVLEIDSGEWKTVASHYTPIMLAKPETNTRTYDGIAFIGLAKLKKETNYSFGITSISFTAITRDNAGQSPEGNTEYHDDDFPPGTFFSVKWIKEL